MTNMATWMTDNSSFQNLTIGQLVIPGTHDSGTYSMTSTLSQINYDGISILWKLQNGSAPANGSAPWANPVTPNSYLLNQLTGSNLYVGPEMYDFIMNVVQDIGQTQQNSLQQQLLDGIRYIDLRVYHDTNIDDFALQHALRCCTLSNALASIREYIDAYPTSPELIVLEVSHANYADPNYPNSSGLLTSFVEILQEYLGPYLLTPPTCPSNFPDSQTFDPFQFLASSTLASITSRQINGTKNTAPTVIVLNTDDCTYPLPVFNSSGYATSGASVDGTDNLATLQQNELNGVTNNTPNKLYRIAWTLTPAASDVIAEAINQLSGAQPAKYVMQTLATTANAALPSFLAELPSQNFNCISVDYYELPSAQTQTVVDLAIAANNQRVQPNS